MNKLKLPIKLFHRGVSLDNYHKRISQKKYHEEKSPNKLISAASKLLSTITMLRNQKDYHDVSKLRQFLCDELKKFQNRVIKLDYDEDTLLIAYYTLAASIDETVSNTSWGEKNHWSENPILQNSLNGASSNEQFFIILDKICQDPEKFIDSIELMYICLNLGFEGKFQYKSLDNKQHLRQLLDTTYQIIRNFRGDFSRNLSSPIAVANKDNNKSNFRCWAYTLLFIVIIIGVLAGIYGWLNYLLNLFFNQTIHQIASILT